MFEFLYSVEYIELIIIKMYLDNFNVCCRYLCRVWIWFFLLFVINKLNNVLNLLIIWWFLLELIWIGNLLNISNLFLSFLIFWRFLIIVLYKLFFLSRVWFKKELVNEKFLYEFDNIISELYVYWLFFENDENFMFFWWKDLNIILFEFWCI